MGRTASAVAAFLLLVFAGEPVVLHGAVQAGSPSYARAVGFSSGVDLVRLNVAVTDQRGQPVLGLGREDFLVREEGVPQTIAIFRPDAVPADVAILIDASASLRGQEPVVRAAAVSFLQTLRPGDRASVTAFDTGVHLLQEWTADRHLLAQAVRRIGARGDTALYQAVYVTLRGFDRTLDDDGIPRRQVVVLLTDGEDSRSLVPFDDLLDAARRAGVTVYAIAVRTSRLVLDARGADRVRFDEFKLKQLAGETGGRCFALEHTGDLPRIYQSIAEELAGQYLLAYVPAPRDDALGRVPGAVPMFRRVSIEVPRRGGASARTRSGYYVGPPESRVASGGNAR